MTTVAEVLRKWRDKLFVYMVVFVWPFVAAAVVLSLFGRPEGAETVTSRVWLPQSEQPFEISQLSTTRETRSVSLEEFRKLGNDKPMVFINWAPTTYLKIVYLGRAEYPNGDIVQYKTEATVAETGYGQRIGKYSLDQKSQTATANLESGYWDVDGLVLGFFPPLGLYAGSTLLSLAAGMASLLAYGALIGKRWW